jgi:hypothetical protein
VRHSCRTFGAQRFLWTLIHALTDVAINFRPFGPYGRAAPEFAMCGNLSRQNLQRYLTMQARVLGEIHLTHAPSAKLGKDFKAIEFCAGGYRHGSEKSFVGIASLIHGSELFALRVKHSNQNSLLLLFQVISGVRIRL